MTLQQYAALMEYIQENNGWGPQTYRNSVKRCRRVFKYVSASFDTRFGDIWHITLHEGGGSTGKSFRVEKKEEIDAVYAYLDEEVKS